MSNYSGLVLILSFTSFKLEQHADCSYDFLQIHDGPSASDHMIGRYCGSTLPNNGHINTTQNQVYLWFKSDASNNGDGFSLVYNAAEPTCGGMLSGRNHGSVTSPGYPGRYPHNRDCTWNIRISPGNKILFTFGHLALEQHQNCSYDYVLLRDGFLEGDATLGRYCSSNDPAPVQTTGPYGQVIFHSDERRNDVGFHITFAAIPSTPGCGGQLTSDSGTVISPNFPNAYPHNAQCIWTIAVPDTEVITLTFTDLNIETTQNCRYDYVEVRDGEDETSPFVGRYCGSQLPPAVVSNGNSLWIKFRSDGSLSNNGFRATWNVECGGTYTDPEGEIRSPYFPNPYPNQKECEFVISQPEGSTIVLTFATFDIEASAQSSDCNYDYLEVRNGASESSALVGRLCGSTIPEPITSSGNAMWLKFHSDGSVQNHGFRATYTTANLGSVDDPITGEACGGTLTSPSGSLSTPSHPSVYPNGVNCTWYISVQEGYSVSLVFQSFNIESHRNCAYDSVSVYNNFSSNSLIGRLCGSTNPGTVMSSSNQMMIIFVSDSSISMEGFAASYSSVNASTVCGGTFLSSFGVLTSPNYPAMYPTSKTCEYIIMTRQGQQILLNVTDFSLESSSGCNEADYLEIRNGGTGSAPLIGQYCGTVIDHIIRSHSNRMYLKFVSDRSQSSRGFSISYDSTLSGCGGEMTGPTGNFISPNYPQAHHMRAECFWLLTVARGSTVNIIFVDLDLEADDQCAYDYVEVRDQSAIGPVRGRFCGSTIPVPVQTKTNRAWLKFRSDYSGTGRGFHITYFANCNNRVTGHSGVIESPNFPNPYPHNRNCTWIIEAARGNTINGSFSHFKVEPHEACQYDFLQLRDGETADSPLIGQYCGINTLPPEVATTGRYLYVKFQSDHSMAVNGFRFEYITVGCGGVLTASEGVIQSPNYPNLYPVARDCVWTIETTPGSRVELTIVDLNMETHHSCQYDFLQAQGGLNEDSPVLFKLCRTTTDHVVYTTTGNRLRLLFRSDTSIAGRGFKLTYREIAGGCGGNYTTASGTIMSQNYPNQYPHNTDCVWNIAVIAGRTVVLTLEDMAITGHESCEDDYIVIYDGPDSSYPTLLRACGITLPDPAQIHSTSNKLTVRMRSDGRVSSRGFKATYKQGCGGTLDASTDGQIVSPGWPGIYDRHTNCSWHLISPNTEDHVSLTFTHLDLAGSTSNCTDYVQILGGDDDLAPEIARFCGNFVPQPVRTQTSRLLINLISTASIVDRTGFRLVYSTSSSACGGEFSSERGAFSSPLYPDSYPHNTECIWTFNTTPGNRILISFTTFNLESSAYCNHDFVEVREGGAAGQVIGRYCGNTVPTNITVGTNLWLKFRSNENVTRQGFQAVFNSLYGGEISGGQGQIASPLYPQNYPNNVDYSWIVTTEIGKLIKLDFIHIELETARTGSCTYDFVKIRDGGSSDSTPVGVYCGTDLPPSFTSTGNQIKIEFHSDYAVSGAGFLLEWQAVPPTPVNPTTPETTTTEACGGNIVAVNELQNVSSPGYPFGYADNQNCIWVIRSEVATRIWLNLTDINTEADGSCRYDYVEFYNGDRAIYGRSFARFCGRHGIGQSYFSNTNVMAIKFRSDSSVNRTGFMVAYKAVCGGLIRSSVGTIQSKNYPNVYGDNSNCTWRVAVQPHRKIKVQVNAIDIFGRVDGQCTGDYLELLNGIDVDSPPLGQGRYCGIDIPTIPMTSSNYLTVKFISDSQGAGQGFKLTFREYLLGCGGSLSLIDTMSSGLIMSPHYPVNYPQNADCIWIITAPPNERIQIDFLEEFNIESHPNCVYDFIEIRDGGTDNSQSIGKFCGRTLPGTQKSSGNVIYVRFRSDNSVPKIGFKLRYQIAQCGGTISGSSGLIESPNYPQSYDNNEDCEWIIHGPTGHFLTFTIEDFHLDGNQNCTGTDIIQIRDFNSTGDTLLRACGSLPVGRIIETSDNLAYIHFMSNEQITYTGFRIRFQASVEECGGDLTTPSGTFSSPNYPGLYAHRRRCSWTIRVASGRRITLAFNDFDLEEQEKCYRYDAVWIINGALSKGYLNPVISIVCGHNNPGTFQSSGNGMKVYFITDGSVSGQGFQATYHSDNPSVCGGLYTISDDVHTIESPGFAEKRYPTSTQCIWQLANHNARNGSISLHFTFLSLEMHGECRWDFVEIREASPHIDTIIASPHIDTIITSPHIDTIIASPRIDTIIASPRIDTIITSRVDENGHMIGRYCGNVTDNLPRIASPAASLWLLFKTDHLESWQGFQLEYSFQSCGGVMTAPNGVISSPNYPASYDDNNDCAWKIQASEGQQIKIHFTAVNIQQSDDCKKDYIDIYNGGLASSPSAGHYCGSVLPPDLLSMSHELRVQFHSDGSISAPGFRLEYEFIENGCGGDVHLSSGQITSPQWPDQYPNNVECQWQLVIPNGYHMKLNFTPPFEMEIQQPCINDYVQISEVLPSGGPSQLGKFCGNQFPPTIQSTSNRVKVKFRSNDHITGNGFALNFTSACGATYADDSGIILSPGYPNNYGNLMLCNYTIAHDPQTFLNIYFDPLHFGIEGQQPKHKHGLTAPEIQNHIANNDTVTSAITPVTLVTPPPPPTFTTAVDFITEEMELPANTTLLPSSASVADRFRQLVLNASGMQESLLGGNSVCPNDWIAIYEGNSTAGHRIGRFCGRTPPQGIHVQGSVFIQFKTDATTTDKGWKIIYNISQCGGDFSGETGTIMTPTYPDSYHHNANCTWIITVPDTGVVELKFNQFVLESSASCAYDYVTVHDGASLDAPLLGRFCGTAVPPPLRSSGTRMSVNFITDQSVARDGFNATWRTTFGPDQGCGGLLNSSTGSFHSIDSNHDNLYEPNLMCVWQIVVPEDQLIKLHFDHFQLESRPNCLEYDYLQIRDGLMPTDPLVGTYCGDNTPGDFTSTTNRLYIKFSTDDNVAGAGFSVNYRTVARLCGGAAIASVMPQNITSPGYPNNYPQSLKCVWTIDTSLGQHIQVNVLDINIPGQGHCQGDYLEFRDIAVSSSNEGPPSSHIHCGNTIPGPYRSYGNTMQIRFITDATDSGRGFVIQYGVDSCNRTYSSFSGRITSPGWPGSYPAHSHCEFLVQSPEGTDLALYFNMFNTEQDIRGCRYDYLQIHNGSSSEAPVLRRVCGLTIPDPVFVTGNSLWLHFQTDSSIHRPGYDITYIANNPGECGGNLTIPEGSFTSPGYPGNYPNISSECRWLIQVPNRQAVTVYFTEFDIPSSEACTADSVSIFSGSSDMVPPVGRYCGQDQSPFGRNITSTSNVMVVIFKSVQSSSPGTGFRLKFYSRGL
ncbi:hypothetical protein LSH36_558g01028 [Paralvinella palmiformis]|uniref:CUB domain-containing protein n=1 Tax=Paralvinella palmiformis TaxID=53620 RepID=A0AAD9MX26_9ANNE|nr:hypothetical protein LSH36_558g01028 [Paralvinella palmiformis]